MKNSILLMLILLILSTQTSFTQRLKKPIDYRFQKGLKGFQNIIMPNIKFPLSSLENGEVGISITRISISPAGKIVDTKIINSIDSGIDNEALRVIKLTSDKWIPCDTIIHNQVFYVQLIFSILGYQASQCDSKLPEFRRLFLDPVMITGIKGNKSTTKFFIDQELADKTNSLLDAHNYNEALPFVNELIKRDPFNEQLYKVRILINSNLNRPDQLEEDKNRIANFAEGLSLDRILQHN